MTDDATTPDEAVQSGWDKTVSLAGNILVIGVVTLIIGALVVVAIKAVNNQGSDEEVLAAEQQVRELRLVETNAVQAATIVDLEATNAVQEAQIAELSAIEQKRQEVMVALEREYGTVHRVVDAPTLPTVVWTNSVSYPSLQLPLVKGTGRIILGTKNGRPPQVVDIPSGYSWVKINRPDVAGYRWAGAVRDTKRVWGILPKRAAGSDS
jgi:hypothetical protein